MTITTSTIPTATNVPAIDFFFGGSGAGISMKGSRGRCPLCVCGSGGSSPNGDGTEPDDAGAETGARAEPPVSFHGGQTPISESIGFRIGLEAGTNVGAR